MQENVQKVVHIKRDHYQVYIGRGSIWGNPFKIGRDGDRAEVLRKYKAYLLRGEGRHLLDRIGELEGKSLGCFCAGLLPATRPSATVSYFCSSYSGNLRNPRGGSGTVRPR